MAGAIVGEPFKEGVRRQLEVRSSKRLSKNITDRDLAVQHGSTSWVRVSSSVVVEGNKDLAKNNVLQGGILSKLYNGFDESGDNSTYTKDGALGFRPVPGIDQVQITAQGDKGSLNKAEVSFTVNSKSQLDDLEKLYLRPGYNVLIEYGHSMYYDNDENIISNVPSVIDFFNATTVESVNKQIKQIREESAYNYDAYLGLIVNFSYSLNQQAGYDCTFYITSKGELIEGISAMGPGQLQNYITKAKNTIISEISLLAGKKPTSETSSKENNSAIYTILKFIYKIAGQQDPLLETLQDEFKNVGFEKEDVPYYLHDVSTDVSNRAKKVYITFNTLLKILNVMNLIIDGKKEVVKLGFNTDVESSVNIKFNTYDNHFSSDPHVCLLKKIPANERLFFGKGAPDFPASSGNLINTDILLDVSFLIGVMDKISDNEEENQSIVDFLQIVFLHVQTALGDINSFDFYYTDNPDKDDTPTVYIVDHKLHYIEDHKRTAKNVVPSVGRGSLVTNLSITSKISKSMAAQASIAASSSGTDLASLLTATTNAFNKGISDKFAKQTKPGTGDKVDTETSEDSKGVKDDHIPTIEKAVETFVGSRSFKISDGVDLQKPHRAIAISDIVKCKNPVPGFMPYVINLNMAGIAGINILQGFVLEEGLLPAAYQENAAFQITGVSHNISSNEWTTDISGQSILLKEDPDKIIKEFEPKEFPASILEKIKNFGTDKSAP